MRLGTQSHRSTLWLTVHTNAHSHSLAEKQSGHVLKWLQFKETQLASLAVHVSLRAPPVPFALTPRRAGAGSTRVHERTPTAHMPASTALSLTFTQAQSSPSQPQTAATTGG